VTSEGILSHSYLPICAKSKKVHVLAEKELPKVLLLCQFALNVLKLRSQLIHKAFAILSLQLKQLALVVKNWVLKNRFNCLAGDLGG